MPCSKGGEPDLLREVGEVRVGEHGHVAHELVDYVGLGGVERHGVVADVLRAEEGTESEPCANTTS